KENKHFSALMREAVLGALERTGIAPEEIESAHVGNFAAELYCMQGHLGAFFTEVHPAFSGLPTSRHEAACASGSIALLAAGAEIEAGRYDPPAGGGLGQKKKGSGAPGGRPPRPGRRGGPRGQGGGVPLPQAVRQPAGRKRQ